MRVWKWLLLFKHDFYSQIQVPNFSDTIMQFFVKYADEIVAFAVLEGSLEFLITVFDRQSLAMWPVFSNLNRFFVFTFLFWLFIQHRCKLWPDFHTSCSVGYRCSILLQSPDYSHLYYRLFLSLEQSILKQPNCTWLTTHCFCCNIIFFRQSSQQSLFLLHFSNSMASIV